MTREDFEAPIQRAIDLVNEARSVGDHPFGAVLALANGRVIEAINTVISAADCTCHAEMNAIKSALRAGWDLAGATLYASTEPCAMCSGASYLVARR